jgi:hypothetical protein
MKFLSDILIKAGLVVEGSSTLQSLAGTGTRMVVANAAGLVSTQAIPVTSVSGTGGYGGLTLSGTVTSTGSLTLGGTPTGTWPISITGNAATVTIANTNVNTSYYIPLVSSAGNVSLLIDGGNDLNYNPSTNVFTIGGSIVINSVVINGGTANQFMKANGTLDSNIYLTGTGVSGRIAFWDSTYGLSSSAAMLFNSGTNNVTFTSLSGTGTRMVVVDATGLLSTQAIPVSSVTSVFGRSGAVTAQLGDYSTTLVTEGTNLYFTNARSRSAITLTTTGTSGASTYDSVNGILNIPSYVGGVTSVNGQTGAVTLTTTNISEGTNLYYTDARARAAISLTTTGSSGAATYSAGVLNIPNYTLSGLSGSTGVAGQVAFWTGASSQSGSNGLFWDSANGRLSVGTDSALFGRLEVFGGVTNFRNAPGLNTLAEQTRFSRSDSILNVRYHSISTIHSNVTATNEMQFLVHSAGSDTSQVASLILTGNGNAQVLNNLLIGSTTDTTERIQVTGAAKITGNTLTNSLRIGNTTTNSPFIFSFVDNSGVPDGAGRNLSVYSYAQSSLGGAFTISGDTFGATTGAHSNFRLINTFAPTSGTATMSIMHLTWGINQTGGANGITRGLYVNPTLTAAADWRSIEWSNNSGWGLYGAGTANNYLAGSLGIGNTSFAGMNLRVSKNITGNATGRSVYLSGDFQSDVSIGYGVQTSLGTQAATFTLSDLIHFQAAQGTKGAASTIGTQIAFDAAAMTNGGTNIAFRGQNASAANVWNLYMAGSAPNYLAGSLGIGTISLTGFSVRVGKNITGATGSYGIRQDGAVQSDVTNFAYGINNSLNISASTTLSSYAHFITTKTAFGAGATLTNQYGVLVDTLTDATNNYGFYGNIASGTGRWNLYMAGTAANYLGGTLTVNNQITAGTAQATSGSTILRSTYSSGNISNIGTNGSSGGMSINYAVYPASTSTADAYLSGVGTLSFPRSSYIVQADHRWLSASAAIVAEGSAVTMTENMRLYNSGNLVIQNGGTYADAGQRLQVYGDTLMKGTGNTSGTTALTVQNSDATNIFRVRNDGAVLLGAALTYTNVGSRAIFTTADEMRFSRTAAATDTSGTKDFFQILTSFSPTSGTAQYNFLLINNGVNQTGGASGITRGLYVNPNLTAAADWRSIEWSNNSGYGLYGAGTAQNLLNGKLTVSHTVTTGAFANANTMGVFGSQVLNIPAGTQGVAGAVYAANSGFHYFRFNGNTTLVGDALWAASISVANLQFDTTGTITLPDGAGGGSRPRALSGMQIQMQSAGNNNGTISRAAGLLIQGCYPSTGTGVTTFTDFAGIRINDLTEWGTARITMTDRWGIYQAGVDDKNYFNGAVLIGTASPTGEKLQVSGTMRVTGAVKLSGLPTSATGLAAGDIWNDLGTLKIV